MLSGTGLVFSYWVNGESLNPGDSFKQEDLKPTKAQARLSVGRGTTGRIFLLATCNH